MARAAIRYKPLAGASVSGNVVKHQYGGTLAYLGQGEYRFTFDVPLTNTNYLVMGGCDRSALVIDPANCGSLNITLKDTDFVEFSTTYGNGALFNFENVNMLVWDEDVDFYNPTVYKPIALANLDGRNKVSRVEYGCSITYGADGVFTLTFDTPLGDDEYYITTTGGDQVLAALRAVNTSAYGTTTIEFGTTNTDGNLVLADYVDIIVWPGNPDGYIGDYKPILAVSFNGITPAVKTEYGLASLVRNSTGNFSANFDVAQSSINYYIIGAGGRTSGRQEQFMPCPGQYDVGFARLVTTYANGGAENYENSFFMVWPEIPANFPSEGADDTQAAVMAVVRIPAPEEHVAQYQALAIINFPADFEDVTSVQATVPVRQSSPIEVEQARFAVVARGRTANPQLHAWAFTLDGHDFYVLRLGDRETLIYDTSTEQWVEWGDLGLPFWRPTVGQNWVGGIRLGTGYGSDVIAGDDTFGLLWVLNPQQPFDQHPDYLNYRQEIYFDRVVMGQVVQRGREEIPCYAVWLTTDMGQPAYTGAGVRLEISDDAGRSYDDMGLVTVTPGLYEPELEWLSLGQIQAPGRLFKITDDGAVARIDGLEMNDPDDDG